VSEAILKMKDATLQFILEKLRELRKHIRDADANLATENCHPRQDEK
jgi:hypothetical protein